MLTERGPDMSMLLDRWTCGKLAENGMAEFESRLFCPSDRSLILDVEVENAVVPEQGKICILRATPNPSEVEELWAVRLTSQGYLELQPGTREALRLATPYSYFASTSNRFKLSLSFDPTLSGIVLATNLTQQILGDKVRNAWTEHVDRWDKPPSDTYLLTVGCQLDGRADKPPLGWTISSRFRFGSRLSGEIRDLLRESSLSVASTFTYTHEDAALHRLYSKAAEGDDHTELSSEWHLGVVAGARAMGWHGGKP